MVKCYGFEVLNRNFALDSCGQRQLFGIDVLLVFFQHSALHLTQKLCSGGVKRGRLRLLAYWLWLLGTGRVCRIFDHCRGLSGVLNRRGCLAGNEFGKLYRGFFGLCGALGKRNSGCGERRVCRVPVTVGEIVNILNDLA